jgi:putative endonuclease
LDVKKYYVYMVMCTDGSYYVGITNDVERRVAEHNYGIDKNCYTFVRRPVVAVHVSEFTEVWQALDCEKKLKGWSHAKKSALVRGDWKLVRALSLATNCSDERRRRVDPTGRIQKH